MLWDVMVNQLKVPLKFTHDLSKETPKECGLGMLIDGKIVEMDSPIFQKVLEILGQLTADDELKSSKDMTLKEWLIWRDVPQQYHLLIDSILAQTNSSCLHTHSAKGAQEEDLNGESNPQIGYGNYHIQGKNTMEHSLIPYLTKNIKKNQIKLNYIVQSIDYSSKLIKINGGEITCDKIILTVPLTTLRNRLIQFTPELSPLRKHLIQNQFHMHGGCKIILGFKKPFWKDQIPNVNVVCVGDQDPLISQFWFSSTSKEQTEKYGHIITGFSMSNRADNGLILGEEEIKDHFRKFIQKTFDLNDKNDGFIGGKIRNWQDVQHVAGAYSFAYTSDSSRRNYIKNPRVLLSQPIDSKLYFAGELYCAHSPATIHGAMETGRDAALRLINESSPQRVSKL
ncbi:predicted protein [Naegleria gruberi]|uniref:Predicted protein n=1 Tax=Naegleria gruberi TaxID=5762 RepID=D2VZ82_NAEGR|nr:uncharacterized protein NAEGRDRAFT_53437 [Naegleria gruberi]EFC37895.1 predicted protein [Naegleria gruberi]|eukprot:XP_002670639.1 predicted protein [Naegleria gruberi strain NEG-M]